MHFEGICGLKTELSYHFNEVKSFNQNYAYFAWIQNIFWIMYKS